MGVRLFVGNLSYATTEADLRSYFGAVGPPSQVVVPVDRETGRPRGFAFVEFTDRAHAEQAIQRFNGQIFNGRPLAVSEARAREDRGPSGPRPGGFSGPRPGGFGGPRPPAPAPGFGGPRPAGGFGGPRPFDSGGVPGAPGRSRNFGPDAKPSRGGQKGAKKKDTERPRGPIPMKTTGRSFTLDDVDAVDEDLTEEIDNFATSKPEDDKEKEKEKDEE
ncbi:MAG: RNA-binding protein [Acidobacteria bacterium]|nr:MAG: RNA-binding protein [Acidobacteriota bacterium]